MNAIADAQLPLTSLRRTGTPPDLPAAAIRTVRRAHGHPWMLALGDTCAAVLAGLFLPSPAFTVALVAAWLLLVALNRGYECRLVRVGVADLSRIAHAGLELAMLGAAVAWTLELTARPGDVLAVVGTVTAVSTGHRVLGSTVGGWLVRRGAGAPRRVVLAGHAAQVDLIAAELAREPHGEFEIAAICIPEDEQPGTGHPVVHGFAAIQDAAREFAVDAVIVLPCNELGHDRLRRLTWDLEASGSQLFVAPGIVDVAEARTTVAAAGAVPMLHIRPAELQGPRQVVKNVVERVVALLMIVALCPLLLALALAVRLDSPGHPIFKQTRVGRNGTEFTMYKFRTMVPGSTKQVIELADRNETDGVLFKIRRDPRITRLGAVLRRYSLDELPQLFNVVGGSMSLVGPRPALPDEVSRYEDDVRRRLAVRPGLTGLWQVSGRSDLSWPETVRLDLAYVDNWTPLLDLRILARTVGAVLLHRGAY